MVLSNLKKKDLLVVIEICTSLHHTAERHLYSRVMFVVPKLEKHDATKWLPVHRFFMTLWQWPELTGMVRYQHFIGVGALFLWEYICALPFDEAVLETWLPAAERLRVASNEPCIRQLIEKGNPSVFTAVLLAM